MGIFSSILEKLGLKSAQAEPAATPLPTSSLPPPSPTPVAAPAPPPVPIAIPVVDVVAQLEKLAASSPQKLNWKTSIVDLLKLLGIDSSFTARKALPRSWTAPPN